jgi:hypothetical protein
LGFDPAAVLAPDQLPSTLICDTVKGTPSQVPPPLPIQIQFLIYQSLISDMI